MSAIFFWLNIDTKSLGSCIELDMMKEYISFSKLNNVIHIDKNNIDSYNLEELIESKNYKFVLLATIRELMSIKHFFKAIQKLSYIPKLSQSTFIHLGDEGFDRPSDNYREKLYSLFKNVIRFGNKDLEKHSNSILVVPMGYISGMNNTCNDLIKASNRKYKWGWLGQIKLDRQIMINNLKTVEPNYFINSNSWGGSMYNIGNKSKELLTQFSFVPCSCGNAHVEGARYAEALESGCIPLLKQYKKGEVKELRFGFGNYYELLFKEKHPLPVFNEWKDINSYLKNISDQDMNELQIICINWWQNLKKKFGIELSDVILL